ncbi:MAG: hypothetical protein HY319_15135 [Armatimonadetes bacterium]|nr:hypothetical protein [Armatimonadota bacterium]
MILRKKGILVVVVLVALAGLLLSTGIAAGRPLQEAAGLQVEMTATLEGKVATYSITLRNPNSFDVGDLFVSGPVPAGATFIEASATAAKSWFRGVESAGVAGNVAVWLSEKVPAGGSRGPFVYQVSLESGDRGTGHAWVRWKLPTEGSASSAEVTPAAAGVSTVVAAYAGSETCKTCHSGTYQSWKNTLHSSMVRPAARGDLSNARADLTLEGAPRPDQYDWALVIGGWYKEERYAYRDTQGRIVTGEFEYNRPKKSFSLRKDRNGNLEALDWINECGACHATGMDPQKRQWTEFNIGCEACHGPGGNHAKNPASVRMYVDKSSENCGKCHIRGRDKSGLTGYPADFEYGKPTTLMAKFNPIPMTDRASVFPDEKNSNRHRQQFLDWSKSDHAQAEVGCITCHDPHKGSLTERKADLRAQGNELCSKCHEKQTSDPVAHSGHQAQVASCAACHLPKLIGSGSVSTHTFEAIAPAKTLQYGETMANSCTSSCHKAQGVEWADQGYKRLFNR